MPQTNKKLKTPGKGQKVKKGSTIIVTVCSKKVATKVKIEDIRGLTPNEAKQKLVDQGFQEKNISIVFETSSEFESDKVFGTDPKIGTEISTDSKIKIFVSKGKDKPTVPNRKRKSKNFTVCRYMILYTENPKDATWKLLELINEFGKVAGYKINAQKSLQFLYTNDEKSEREIKETLPYTTATKRIKYLGINLPKETKDMRRRPF